MAGTHNEVLGLRASSRISLGAVDYLRMIAQQVREGLRTVKEGSAGAGRVGTGFALVPGRVRGMN